MIKTCSNLIKILLLQKVYTFDLHFFWMTANKLFLDYLGFVGTNDSKKQLIFKMIFSLSIDSIFERIFSVYF